MKLYRFLLVVVLIISGTMGMVGLIQGQEDTPAKADGENGRLLAAAVASEMNYQGVLKESGVLVTGSRDMVFRFYADDICNAQLYSDPVNGVTVNNGLFSADVSIPNGYFDGRAIWVQVEVAGTTLGCEALQPVPYARSLVPGSIISHDNGYGLRVESTNQNDGLRAYSNSTNYNYAAVWAINNGDGGGSGLFGRADYGYGVYAKTITGTAVYAASEGTGEAGYFATTNNTTTVFVNNQGEGDGVTISTSSDGGTSSAANYAVNFGNASGVYGSSTGGGYGGYFPGNIFVGGACTGCNLAYLAINSGDKALQVGDLVAISGMGEALAGTQTPLMQVTAVNSQNATAVVGVVQSAGQFLPGAPKDGVVTDGVIQAEGDVQPGGYLFVVVQGLAQVKVGANDTAIQAGDMLIMGDMEAISTKSAAEGRVIGQAMETLSQGNSLMWVMLNLR